MRRVERPAGHLRIGELGRRVGVRPELLRAWENRYGLLTPSRSPGGFRLYSEEDERRVRAMRAHLARGVSAAEAARLVLAGEPEPNGHGLEGARVALSEALGDFDEARANRILDELLAAYTVDTLLADAILPYLHELGERWASGEASVAEEHFASNVVRGRLLGLARGWGQGAGPRALLACVPGELHDLALLAFGLALRARGWRVAFLGPDTPLDEVEAAAEALAPDLVVCAASRRALVDAALPELRRLAASRRVALAGRGATAEHAAAAGAELLAGDPVAEAERLAGA